MKKTICYILLIAGSIIMVLPFVWMISTSLKTSGATFTFPPEFIPKHITFENFREVQNVFPVWKFFFNSLIVAVISTAGHIIVSAMSAYAFARFEFKGRDLLFFLYLATLMVPSQVTLTPLFIMIKYLNWANTYQALIMPGMFTAFGTFLMRQFFLTLPGCLEESAFIDGAGYFRTFFSIILPLSKSAIATLGIFQFMASWNNYLWPLIITSDVKMMTLTVGLKALEGRWNTNWNMVMAGTLINIIPIVVVYVIAQKHIIKGMSHTGMK